MPLLRDCPKKKIRAGLVAALTAATSLVVLVPQPAAACDRHPCYTKCEINKDYATVGDDGTVTFSGRPYECYY